MRSPTRISPPRPRNSHTDVTSTDPNDTAYPAAYDTSYDGVHDPPQTGSYDPAPGTAHSGPGPAAYSNPYEELAELADPYDPDDPLGLGLKADDEDDPDGESADDEPWSPPNHRRRSRRGRSRFAAVPIAAKLVIGALVATALLLLADRCAVMYAEKKAEEQLQKKMSLATAPNVTIHGFPFLTQVWDKRLDEVDVTVPDVAANRVSLAEVSAKARDIRLTGDLPSSIHGAVAGQMKGDVLLAFEDLNRELGASQLRFRATGPESVRADGKLPVAGQEVTMHAMARIRRDGDRGISTSVSGMRLDMPGVATYRPGRHEGLRLHRKTAERISRDAEKAKALLTVGSVARQLGVEPESAGRSVPGGDERVDRITTSPKFVPALMKVNFVDLVAEHPQLVKRLGINPAVASALTKLKVPELSEKLSLSFQLPKKAKGVHIQNIRVRPDGIVADLVGTELHLGKTR
ncbi:DUF2993 domain-containing protein [Streptomyces sp. NA02950]|uniref:LmeA family phospholipid-binding protein n=1 Tax=Streptomyces sp. NA02950 TaxID=2742137 RepID=UPI00158FF5F2|nr:DUF2993 domain-containing protein [Streptomyces sp. NA02950]QKV93449.1 DUF2993 domain-containing protein [Streptomyces sp. NA02950]